MKLLIANVLALALPATGFALIMGKVGNDPVKNRGWPTKSEHLANLKTRIAWWEGPPFGGGQYKFEFRGKTTDDFNAALEAFSEIKCPRRELVLQNGPGKSFWLSTGGGKKDKDGNLLDTRIDWIFEVWIPSNWNHLFNHPRNTHGADFPNFRRPVDPPRMIAYLGGEGSTIDWERVAVPKNVDVIDRRAEPGASSSSVTGSVYEMDTGQVIEGATVTLVVRNGEAPLELPATKTGADGAFSLANIPEGHYPIAVSHPDYATKHAAAYHDFRMPSKLRMDFHLSKKASLSGVLQSKSGKPVAAAKIRIGDVLGMDGRGYPGAVEDEIPSDDEGRFTVEGLPVGFCKLSVRADGYHYPQSVTRLHDVPSKEPIVLELVGTGTVRGKLTGETKRQKTVSIEPVGGNVIGSWGGSMHCKEDGSYEFKGVPEGDYFVGLAGGITLRNADPPAKKVTVKAGEVHEVDVDAE